jgi:hypothetical protein
MSNVAISRTNRNSMPGAWPMARVLEVLGTRVAMSAIRGKPSPVAATVLARLESQNSK